ncbi:MAG: DEAD/DEAH box helicase [Flavobacteriales bacterium]
MNYWKNLGIDALNSMQETFLETAKENDHVLLLSPTGSGKTLAFLLASLESLDVDNQDVQLLILAPSRELSLQIFDVFKGLKTPFSACCCYGGNSLELEKKQLRNQVQVVIATPGRLTDHIARQHINCRSIKVLIVDEYDKSLEFGFHRELDQIFEELESVSRLLLTSATKPKSLPYFSEQLDIKTVDCLQSAQPKLQFKTIKSVEKDKTDSLYQLLCWLGGEKSIVFCNHREAVERISERLKKQGVAHGKFHGGLEQIDRERTLLKFRNGTSQILLCTDLAARGIDITDVKHVIHYQIPRKLDDFVHRNGRTARMNKSGLVYVLLNDSEFKPDYIQSGEAIDLPKKVNPIPPSEWETLYISGGKKDKIGAFDLVGFVCKKGGLEADEVGKIDVKQQFSFVAVKANKTKLLIQNLNNQRLKKKKVRVSVAM